MVLFLSNLGLNVACPESSLGIIDCLGAKPHEIVGSLRLSVAHSLVIMHGGWLSSSFLLVTRKRKLNVLRCLVRCRR
jgi:hypothetical protein